MIRALALAATALALPALGACQQEQGLRVENGWVRLPAVAGRPGAAYFTLHGGAQPVRLLSVTSPVVIRTEMHDTMKGMQGMMQMRPMAGVDVPARSTVKFEPGGKHVMLFNVNPGIKPGRAMEFTLTFADGTQLTPSFTARPANATGPAE